MPDLASLRARTLALAEKTINAAKDGFVRYQRHSRES